MASESDDDDFLSADEGEGHEKQSKISKTDGVKTKFFQAPQDRNEDLKERRDRPSKDFGTVFKHNEDQQQKNLEKSTESDKSIKDTSIEKLNAKFDNASIDKLSTKIDKCKIDEEKEEKSSISNTEMLSKNVENANDTDNFNLVCKDTQSSNTEIENVITEILTSETKTSGEQIKEEERVEVAASHPMKTETHTGNTSSSCSKPIKEAKIGFKKPREKLSERLGSKKIGSRITKPLVGISSDSLCNQNKMSTDQESSSTDQESSTGSKLSGDGIILSDVKDMESNEGSKEDESFPGWSSWGDWGYTLANTATLISKEVTRGVGTVLETMESSIGAPDPEELAREMVEKERKLQESEAKNKSSEKYEEMTENEAGGLPSYSFGFGSLGTLVSGVSGALETASNKVLLGGLDTLEKIGRKTMDIIQDGDPGLRRKRAFLKSKKQNLSMVLLEARERAIAEEELRSMDASGVSDKKKQVSMALIWDNTEGPAHNEALSLVAKQCQGKIPDIMNQIASVYQSELQAKLADIKNCVCLNEEDKTENIPSRLMEITRDVKLPLQFNKVLTGWPALQQFLSRLSIEIHGLGLDTEYEDIQRDLYTEMANYVAQVVCVFHKAAEVSLITSNLNCVQIAQEFQRLYGCISGGLEKFSDDVCESISQTFHASDPEFNGTITNIYLQMAEVNSYLEVALIDLNTVLQYAQVKVTYDDLL